MFRLLNNIHIIAEEKKIKIKYQKGYRAWKKKFNKLYKETNSVIKTLDKIHGITKTGGK